MDISVTEKSKCFSKGQYNPHPIQHYFHDIKYNVLTLNILNTITIIKTFTITESKIIDRKLDGGRYNSANVL